MTSIILRVVKTLIAWPLKALIRALYAILSRALPSRKIAFRLIRWQLVALSLLLNVFFVSQIWNVRCSEGGWFVRKDQCHTLSEWKIDAQRSYSREFMEANADILN